MADLSEFLAARLDEDKQAVIDGASQRPERTMREVAAKRAIIARHAGYHSPAMCGWCSNKEESTDWPCPDILDLAAVWSDHPDYDPAWAPGHD